MLMVIEFVFWIAIRIIVLALRQTRVYKMHVVEKNNIIITEYFLDNNSHLKSYKCRIILLIAYKARKNR